MFEKGWIEVEDCDNKCFGGFCIDFFVEKESCIFMIYDGVLGIVVIFVYEFGYVFYLYVICDEFFENIDYLMNVVEIVLIFVEMIIVDVFVKDVKIKEEKIMLLEDKIGCSIVFFMNIYVCFIFECNFYEVCK